MGRSATGETVGGLYSRDERVVAVDPGDSANDRVRAPRMSRVLVAVVLIAVTSTVGGMILDWLLQMGPIGP